MTKKVARPAPKRPSARAVPTPARPSKPRRAAKPASPPSKPRAAKPAPRPSPPAKPPMALPPPPPTVELPTTYPIPGSARPHPALGVGLWALGRWTREDEARTEASIERALARGLVWYDTAEVYGNGRSERLLGSVLTRTTERPAEPFLVSKVSWDHLRPGQVRAALTGTLQRLGRDRIDLYLIHAPDRRVPLTETMPVLEELWKEGKVGAIGVSNFSLEDLEGAQAALREAKIAVNQVCYNLFNREDGEAVLDHCRAQGILIEAYTPLARGLLAGKYLDGERPPIEVRRFARDLFDEDHFGELVGRSQQLKKLADRAKVPMASLALHWLRRQGCAPVVGVSRPDQVDLLLEAWSHVPTDAVLDQADALARG